MESRKQAGVNEVSRNLTPLPLPVMSSI